MKLHAALLGVMLSASLVSATVAGETTQLSRLFPQEADLFVNGQGLSRLELPADILAACQPDLSDLRIFDRDGREIAFLVDSGTSLDELVAVKQQIEGQVLDVRREEIRREDAPPLHRETYEIEVPSDPPETGVWDLVIATGHSHFVRRVQLSFVREDGSSVPLVEGDSLFRLQREGSEKTRLRLPPLSVGRLVITVEGEDGFFLEPKFRFESERRLARDERAVIELGEVSRRSHEGKTTVQLARPPGVVPDLLRVGTSTRWFDRHVQVWDERAGFPATRLGGGNVYRVRGNPTLERVELRVDAASRERLRVEISDGDSPVLEELRFYAIVRRPVVIFELNELATDAAAGVLRFGGGRAHRPHYDLAGLLPGAPSQLHGQRAAAAARLSDASELLPARLGPIRRNPAYDDTPALAFAMRPGSEIDARVFSHRRELSIVPSAEGLTRIQLKPEDVARARPDLADVRVVDAKGRQWPYLLDQRGAQTWQALEINGPTREKSFSRYEFHPPVRPLTMSQITLETDTPFFDRPFRLLLMTNKRAEPQLVVGRLTQEIRQPGPATITFPPTLVDHLVLLITDGDDAPLEFRDARTQLSLPEIFLAAPEGEYFLLLGQPKAKKPRYELTHVREIVLAVNSAPVNPGALQSNPEFSRRARLTTGEAPMRLVQQVLLWGALLIAVAFLGILTLRIVRGEAPPEE